jgi:hypothetical protein
MVTTKNGAATLAPKTTQPNGNDSKTPAVKLPTIQPEKREDVKPENKKFRPTIEEKILKLEELNQLSGKRDLLKEALKNVSNFYISPSGNVNVKMTDSNGKSFSIAHPFVIEEIQTIVLFKLEQELDKIETLIDFQF